MALAPGLRGELGDQSPGHARRQQSVAARHDAHGTAEVVRLHVLEQEAARAGVQRLEHVLVQVEGRQDDHAHLRQLAIRGDPARSLEAVHAGHADVHQDDVRPAGAYVLEGGGAVGHFADHLDVVGALE
jgi:hypothetical protein